MRFSSRLARLERLVPPAPCPLDGLPRVFVVRSEEEHAVVKQRLRDAQQVCTCGTQHHVRIIFVEPPTEVAR